MIMDKLEDYKEYVQKTIEDPTSNHLGHKRGDEINKAIVSFVERNPGLSFTYNVVRSGRSPHEHVKLFDHEKKNLIIFKKVDSVEKLPKKMFNQGDSEDISQYVREYAQVNKKYDKQLALSFDDDELQFNTQDQPEEVYDTLAIVTFELTNSSDLYKIAIGVPNHNMDQWIEQKSWSEYIPVSHSYPSNTVEVEVEEEETPDLDITLREDRKEENNDE